MDLWDVMVTAIKFCIITALWYVSGSLVSALFLYFLLVPLPLMAMRILSGLGGASLSAVMLGVVGLDLLLSDKCEA
jgi:hypothetical protein